MVSPRWTQYRGSNGTKASVSWASLENVADKQVLYLTTVGRRTGLPREIEIWFVVWCERLYLFAETDEAAGWAKNIRRNPKVTVRIGEWNTVETPPLPSGAPPPHPRLELGVGRCPYAKSAGSNLNAMKCCSWHNRALPPHSLCGSRALARNSLPCSTLRVCSAGLTTDGSWRPMPA